MFYFEKIKCITLNNARCSLQKMDFYKIILCEYLLAMKYEQLLIWFLSFVYVTILFATQ